MVRKSWLDPDPRRKFFKDFQPWIPIHQNSSNHFCSIPNLGEGVLLLGSGLGAHNPSAAHVSTKMKILPGLHDIVSCCCTVLIIINFQNIMGTRYLFRGKHRLRSCQILNMLWAFIHSKFTRASEARKIFFRQTLPKKISIILED